MSVSFCVFLWRLESVLIFPVALQIVPKLTEEGGGGGDQRALPVFLKRVLKNTPRIPNYDNVTHVNQK